MSHHSRGQVLQADGDSFWEPDNYKRTTKRIGDGYELCTNLQDLIFERAKIERAYAKNLRAWSKDWNKMLEKGLEYGTMKGAWEGILTEAERLSDVHFKINKNLCTGEMKEIKSWQKDNYHMSIFQIKERKKMEKQFKQAQKPWQKYLAKWGKTEAEYQVAVTNEKTAIDQEEKASNDMSISKVQIIKLEERVRKTKDDVVKCDKKYKQAQQLVNKYRPVYIEDMTSAFDKCQEMEESRLHFFKKVFFSLQKTLNVTRDENLPKIYDELYHTIDKVDHQMDLDWWSKNHGVKMSMNWPSFVKQETIEEARGIADGNISSEILPETSTAIIHQRPFGQKLPEYSPPQMKRNSEKTATEAAPLRVNNTDNSRKLNNLPSGNTSTPPGHRNSPMPNRSTNSDGNDGKNMLEDNGKPGIPVRALYDYDGAESDELSFKQDDIFEKLEDEDEIGWCKGRKDGRVGLYPVNYVAVINPNKKAKLLFA